MRSSRAGMLMVGEAATVGWFWHILQDQGVPFWIRMPLGTLILAALGLWLGHRLSEGYWAFPDLSRVRLVPPPRKAHWHIVAVPYGRLILGRREQVIGGYRSRRVAAWIAKRLPKHAGVRLEVRPAEQVSQSPDPGPFAPTVDPCCGCGCAKADHRDGRCIGDFFHCPCETWMPLDQDGTDSETNPGSTS